MAKPRNCSKCRNSPEVVEFDILGGCLVICTRCRWANEGGDRWDAIDQWNEAHGGERNADNDK
jgi:hypothetical protein